ncbi:MAG: TldD/PmbA family protein, partial [Bacilli bacterium]
LKTQEKLKKEPHLEIIALSNIQIDIYSGYIGGEVRLANYFDGEQVIPVSGFSFSGDLNKCLSNLYLSKETIIINRYEGPRYIKLIDIDIL